MNRYNSESRASRCRQLLRRSGLYCRMCGVATGDIDDLTRQEAQFCIARREDECLGFGSGITGPVALCSTCYDGAMELAADRALGARLYSKSDPAGLPGLSEPLSALLKQFSDGG